MSAAVWGIFWVPLRAMHEAGIGAGWTTTAFYLVPALLVLPIALRRWQRLAAGWPDLAVTGLFAGGAFALYANSLMLTEVVRALLLFYLTPVWSTILERMVFGVPIRGVRIVAIVLGLSGLGVILGIDSGLPLPRNAGDWMGLVSGVAWAVAAVRIRADSRNDAFEQTFAYFVLGTLVGMVTAVLFLGGADALPDVGSLISVAPWFVAFVAVVVLPSSYFIVWGAARLSPGLVGILFMTEISVGTVTAALWAGEPFGLREILGVALVTSAGAVELAAVKPVRR